MAGHDEILPVCDERFKQFTAHCEDGKLYRGRTYNTLLMVGLSLLGIVYNIITTGMNNASLNGRLTAIVENQEKRVENQEKRVEKQGEEISAIRRDFLKLSASKNLD